MHACSIIHILANFKYLPLIWDFFFRITQDENWKATRPKPWWPHCDLCPSSWVFEMKMSDIRKIKYKKKRQEKSYRSPSGHKRMMSFEVPREDCASRFESSSLGTFTFEQSLGFCCTTTVNTSSSVLTLFRFACCCCPCISSDSESESDPTRAESEMQNWPSSRLSRFVPAQRQWWKNDDSNKHTKITNWKQKYIFGSCRICQYSSPHYHADEQDKSYHQHCAWSLLTMTDTCRKSCTGVKLYINQFLRKKSLLHQANTHLNIWVNGTQTPTKVYSALYGNTVH